MTVAEIIVRLGGTKAVQGLTGLSKGRISQWRTENHIPTPWERYFRSARPDAFEPKRRKRTEARA